MKAYEFAGLFGAIVLIISFFQEVVVETKRGKLILKVLWAIAFVPLAISWLYWMLSISNETSFYVLKQTGCFIMSMIAFSSCFIGMFQAYAIKVKIPKNKDIRMLDNYVVKLKRASRQCLFPKNVDLKKVINKLEALYNEFREDKDLTETMKQMVTAVIPEYVNQYCEYSQKSSRYDISCELKSDYADKMLVSSEKLINGIEVAQNQQRNRKFF